MGVGVKELKELLAFVVALIQAISDSLSDGKIGFTDLFKFFKAFRKAGPAFKGLPSIREEIKQLDEEKKKELSDYVAKELDIENDLIEGYIEQALAVCISLLDLLPLGESMKKVNVKAEELPTLEQK